MAYYETTHLKRSLRVELRYTELLSRKNKYVNVIHVQTSHATKAVWWC